MFFKQLARGHLLKQGIIFEAQIKDLYRFLKTTEFFKLKRKTSFIPLRCNDGIRIRLGGLTTSEHLCICICQFLSFNKLSEKSAPEFDKSI